MAKKETAPKRGRPLGSGYFTTAINLRLSDELRQQIQSHGDAHGFKVISDAARDLIKRGLESSKSHR